MKKTITLIDILAAAIGFPLAQCFVALFLSHDWGLAAQQAAGQLVVIASLWFGGTRQP